MAKFSKPKTSATGDSIRISKCGRWIIRGTKYRALGLGLVTEYTVIDNTGIVPTEDFETLREHTS